MALLTVSVRSVSKSVMLQERGSSEQRREGRLQLPGWTSVVGPNGSSPAPPRPRAGTGGRGERGRGGVGGRARRPIGKASVVGLWVSAGTGIEPFGEAVEFSEEVRFGLAGFDDDALACSAGQEDKSEF